MHNLYLCKAKRGNETEEKIHYSKNFPNKYIHRLQAIIDKTVFFRKKGKKYQNET